MELLDEAQLAAIYDLAGEEMVGMVEDFAGRSRSTLGDLQRLVGAGELAAGVDLAHQIKGSAASLGMAGLAAQAGRVEDALRGGGVPEDVDLQGLPGVLEESVGAVLVRLGQA